LDIELLTATLSETIQPKKFGSASSYWIAPQTFITLLNAVKEFPINTMDSSWKKYWTSSFLPHHLKKGQAPTAVKFNLSEQIFRFMYQML